MMYRAKDGTYPLSTDQVRSRSSIAFGADPTPDVLASAKVDSVQETTPPLFNPETQSLSEGDPVKVDGVWRQTWIITNIEPPVMLTYKADVWRRATPAQADMIDTELQKLDVVSRRLWDDASYLDHSDENVQFFKSVLADTFGQEEADRIMAASDV